MALSDPFQTTYEGAKKGFGAYGTALEQIAEEFAKKKRLEREYQLKAQYPDPFTAMLAQQFGLGQDNRITTLPTSPEEAIKQRTELEKGLPEEYTAEPVYGIKSGLKYISGYKAEVKPEIEAERKKEKVAKAEAKFQSKEVEGMVDAVWTAAEKLIPAPEDIAEAERVGMGRTFKTLSLFGLRPQRAMGISDENALAFDQVKRAEATPLIRSLGEKGMLTNLDIERAYNLMPSFSDSKKLRETKKQEFKNFLNSKIRAHFKTPQEQTKETQPQQYSQQDLEFTAKKHGISMEEVKKKLGVQ